MKTLTAPCHTWPTIREAAAELGVSYSHAGKLVRANEIRSVKLGDHRNADRRVDPTSIVDYLARVHLPERRQERRNRKPELLEVVPAYRSESARGPVCGTRYPLRPLVILVEIDTGEPATTTELARRFDVPRTIVLRARWEGLSERRADEWAIRIGYHPSLVWGEDWWNAYEAQQRTESMRRHPSSRSVAIGGFANTEVAA